jgi:hypothetical protein
LVLVGAETICRPPWILTGRRLVKFGDTAPLCLLPTNSKRKRGLVHALIQSKSGWKWPSRRTRWVAVSLVAVVTACVSLLAGGAEALTSVTATENVSTGIAIDAAPTSLGSVSLSAGGSYVVLAKVNLRSSALAPVSVECSLTAPGDENDSENASFSTAKGTAIHNLSFLGVSSQYFHGNPSALGNASLSCRATSAAASLKVIAHDARIVAIPVDAVRNNLGTLSYPGQ